MNAALLAQARELQRRLQVRGSLASWSRIALNYEPALHHRILIEALERVAKGDGEKLIVMMPPGSAKSRYGSIALPPWFLAQRPGKCILACSYSYDLAKGFGRTCRNLVELHPNDLGYSLASDSGAAGEWETSNGGRYFCAGTNAGIAGHRADLGVIDDPIGSQLEADSKTFRDRLWDWYWNDFVPRLKPGAGRVIICNRRHEDDLVGRLLALESGSWRVIKLQMEARDGDVLGRKHGERLWPEWFTDKMLAEAKTNPRTFACLYQQEPTPEKGDFFQREWLVEYQPGDLSKNLVRYATSDHAVSTAAGANKSCFLPFGVDDNDDIWILPDVFWKVASPLDCVNEMVSMAKRHGLVRWRAEKGHISKSLMPLIHKRMRECGVYFTIEEVTPTKSKRARASSIAGRMQMGKVHFPAFAPWWSDARTELLSFTGSGDDKADDFCDALAHIGMMMDKTNRGELVLAPEQEEANVETPVLTGKWLKEQAESWRSVVIDK